MNQIFQMNKSPKLQACVPFIRDCVHAEHYLIYFFQIHKLNMKSERENPYSNAIFISITHL